MGRAVTSSATAAADLIRRSGLARIIAQLAPEQGRAVESLRDLRELRVRRAIGAEVPAAQAPTSGA